MYRTHLSALQIEDVAQRIARPGLSTRGARLVVEASHELLDSTLATAPQRWAWSDADLCAVACVWINRAGRASQA